MRTKNDETDAKFRGLQDELNASKAELAVAQLGKTADGTGAQASTELRELEKKVILSPSSKFFSLV
jgi:Fic family protein